MTVLPVSLPAYSTYFHTGNLGSAVFCALSLSQMFTPRLDEENWHCQESLFTAIKVLRGKHFLSKIRMGRVTRKFAGFHFLSPVIMHTLPPLLSQRVSGGAWFVKDSLQSQPALYLLKRKNQTASGQLIHFRQPLIPAFDMPAHQFFNRGSITAAERVDQFLMAIDCDFLNTAGDLFMTTMQCGKPEFQ